MKNLNELHSQIIDEITQDRHKEIKSFLAEKRENNLAAEEKQTQAIEQLKAMGLDYKKYESFQNKLDKNNTEQLKSIRKKYTESSVAKTIYPDLFKEQALKATIVPDNVRIIPPSFAGIFSTEDKEDKLSGGTGTDVSVEE